MLPHLAVIYLFQTYLSFPHHLKTDYTLFFLKHLALSELNFGVWRPIAFPFILFPWARSFSPMLLNTISWNLLVQSDLSGEFCTNKSNSHFDIFTYTSNLIRRKIRISLTELKLFLSVPKIMTYDSLSFLSLTKWHHIYAVLMARVPRGHPWFYLPLDPPHSIH